MKVTSHRELAPALYAALLLLPSTAHPADVYGKRFDPPRAYFAHSSINKNGVTSAIRGQVNFIDIYMTPIDNTSNRYTADGFSWSVLLPAVVRMPDAGEQGLTVEPVEHNGRSYLRISKPFDARQVEIRSMRGAYGSSHEWLWYWIDDEQEIPGRLQEIKLALQFRGKTCFTDTSRLKIYGALHAPRLSPRHFKLWLHYGPRYRMGKWNELADYMARAGFNTIQSLESIEFNREMKKRGFYIIHQRSGSYHEVYEKEFQDCIAEGPAWFRRQDATGICEERLRVADASIFDFEPGPAGKITEFRDDPWLHDRFKSQNKLPGDTILTEGLVKSEYFTEWVDMRQELGAQVVKNWAAYCRSVNPEIATIITQGGVNSFDMTSDVDHLRYADDVTYIDPMNFTGRTGLQNVKKWMERVPRGRFAGCQNVSAGGYSNLFISDQDMMLHTLGAALIGCKGTSFYPGWTLDGANFVLLNRVMTFLADHQEILFAGTPDPPNLILAALPREDTEIDLGGGTTIRNTFPDWSLDAVIRGFHHRDSNQYLVVINNRNTSEPCFVQLTAAVPGGEWFLTDRERKEVFLRDGEARIPSSDLADGIYLHSPPADYRGYRLMPVTPESALRVQSFRPVPLGQIREKAQAYPEEPDRAGDAVARDRMRLGFDDFDRDRMFEYRIDMPGQSIWVGQGGTILKWKVGEVEVRTVETGLCRDMLWMPSSERSNPDMDTVMKLEEKRVHDDGVDLVFRKGVKLPSLGGMVSLQVRKAYHFSRLPGRARVTVTFFNDSLSMEVPAIDLSYRVHNYIDHEERAKAMFWVNDGSGILRSSEWKMRAILHPALSRQEKLDAFTRCELLEPRTPASFGEYLPQGELLLTVHPDNPSRILQLLSWRPENSLEPHATLEWMYRPITLPQGSEATYAYGIDLRSGVESLSESAIVRAATGTGTESPRLLFHADFENDTDATTLQGTSGQPEVTGSPAIVETPEGSGIHLPEGATLSYLPEGIIDPGRGKFQIRFKPLWHGGDNQNRFFMQLNPSPGFAYLGKLKDGRYLLNLFDVDGEQHWPHSSLDNLEPGGWHTATATWDVQQGSIQLIFDGERVAQLRGEPWSMGELENEDKECRLVIGAGPIVIEEIKIWDRP